ncbi:MAG: SUMF1/EgtB/PvdO family nonheme iron enzyme, partial [Nitrospinota bacterium]|nr:SUMF1/EgtB/PvdO family nonheme iron enzyme [Nitrospinota bacterium]
LLTGEPQWFPLPVYFPLGVLPEGTGFSRFFDLFFESVMQVILMEQEEEPGLELDKALLAKTLDSLASESRFLFMLDGLDQLATEDRFLAYKEIVLDGEIFRGNFVILATRHCGFGPLAAEAVMKKGRDSCFQVSFDKITSQERKNYLTLDKEIEALHLYNPELLETPILLKMIRDLQSSDLLQDLKTKTQIYNHYFSRWLVSQSESAEASGKSEVESLQAIDCLAETAFQFAKDGCFQRFEEVETAFDKDVFGEVPGKAGMFQKEGAFVPQLHGIVEETHKGWQFRHPSFQEYLAARRLTADLDWQTVVREHCRDEKWEEIWKFFAGLNPTRNNEFYEILLRENALFAAGNALQEAQQLAEDKTLVTKQFLKYQCKDQYPQFSRFRLVVVEHLKEKVELQFLSQLIAGQLERSRRDSRVLFGVLEVLLFLHGIDFLEMVDRQDFVPLAGIPELKEFLAEVQDPQKVNAAVITKWGEMVTVPAGKFIYQEEKDEEDQINLREFSIMKFPVTNALYKEFDPNCRLFRPQYSNEGDQPVIGINYFEAHVFVIWLGRRLPTEKEWEKAARGVDDRIYPWGDAMGYQSGYTNTSDFVIGRTNKVTEFDQGNSPYGCYDMAGNVWEWCVQLFASNYTTQKILRGGSWLNYMVHAKCTYRNSFDPGERYPSIGLRCVSLHKTEIDDEQEDDEG